MLATQAHINDDLFRMRTIYIIAGSLSRRFSTAKQQQAVPTSDLIDVNRNKSNRLKEKSIFD
jgi:hypothetical protein